MEQISRPDRLLSGKVAIVVLLCLALSVSASYGEEVKNTLTLSDGLRIATENSRVIRIANQDLNMASQDVIIARSGMLPSVNASLSQTFLAYQPGARFGPQSVPMAERSSFSYGINAMQTLYDFGATASRYDSSKTNLASRQLNIDLARNLVALNFIDTYFDLLEAEKMMVTAHKEVEMLESHVKVAESLYNAGVITKNDLLQGVVRLSDARQRLLNWKNNRSFNASRLNNLLQKPLTSGVSVADVADNSASAASLMTLDNAWVEAEKQRKELNIIDSELKETDFDETFSKSWDYPRFFAQAGYNYAENQYQLHEGNWSLMLGMNINLFNGGSSKAGVSKARYRREQLLEQKKKLLDDIRLGVEKNYLDIRNATDRIQVTKDAISQAEENLRINKVRYEEGVGTSTDVLDAITLLTTAETNFQRAVYELRRAEAGFMYSIGADLVSAYK